MSTQEARPTAEISQVEDFTRRLQEWQDFFLNDASPEDIEEYLGVAQEQLDDAWPYMGEKCLFSGLARYPKFEVDDEGSVIVDESHSEMGELEEAIGYSQGVTHLLNEGGKPVFFFDFYMFTVIDRREPTCPTTREYHTFLDQHGEIVPLGSIEEAFRTEDRPEPILKREEYLTKASDNFINMLRSTGFRRMSHHNQQKAVRNYVRQSEEVSGVFGEEVVMRAGYVFSNRLHDGRIQYDYRYLGGRILEGRCHGLGSVETDRLQHKAIRRDRDMVDPEVGLCLVVEDLTDQKENPIPRGPILYVPITRLQPGILFGSDRFRNVENNEGGT
jgi:hypothetical protein